MKQKTPLTIRIAATLAIVAMLALIAVAVKFLIAEPQIVTNTERIILPNDSLITLREEIGELRGKHEVLQAVAAARLETIRNLTSPLSNISDSLIALQRNIEAGNVAQRLAVERDRSDRADRYQTLKESADRVERLQRDVPGHFMQLEQNIMAIMRRAPDTVRIQEPRRRNFFNRLFSRS